MLQSAHKYSRMETLLVTLCCVLCVQFRPDLAAGHLLRLPL